MEEVIFGCGALLGGKSFLISYKFELPCPWMIGLIMTFGQSPLQVVPIFRCYDPFWSMENGKVSFLLLIREGCVRKFMTFENLGMVLESAWRWSSKESLWMNKTWWDPCICLGLSSAPNLSDSKYIIGMGDFRGQKVSMSRHPGTEYPQSEWLTHFLFWLLSCFVTFVLLCVGAPPVSAEGLFTTM